MKISKLPQHHHHYHPITTNNNNSHHSSNVYCANRVVGWCSNSRFRLVLFVCGCFGFLFLYHLWSNENDIYARTPFCDNDGTCHEKPDQPSPRTIYSARSKWQYDQWWYLHAKLNQTAQTYATKRSQLKLLSSSTDNVQEDGTTTDTKTKEKDSSTSTTSTIIPSRPLLLLGDSITESWMGTNMGLSNRGRLKGVPQVLEELLSTPTPAQKLDPLILAISGDQTQHLLWRLQNGQLLEEYAQDPKSIFVVLIGTNNLGSGELPMPTAQGILAIAKYLLEQTQGHILMLSLLPRGDGKQSLKELCPPRCNSKKEPFTSFLPAIQKVNQALEQGILDLAEQHSATHRLGIMDCGQEFLLVNTNKDDNNNKKQQQQQEEVDLSLMPDRLHPNAAGHRILGSCIMKYVLGLEKG